MMNAKAGKQAADKRVSGMFSGMCKAFGTGIMNSSSSDDEYEDEPDVLNETAFEAKVQELKRPRKTILKGSKDEDMKDEKDGETKKGEPDQYESMEAEEDAAATVQSNRKERGK